MGVKKLLINVPVSKLQKAQFFRIHPSDDMTFAALLLEQKESRESYMVMPEVASQSASWSVPVQLYAAIDRQNNVFLIPVLLPGEDGTRNPWHESRARAVELAKPKWVRINANKFTGGYDVYEAQCNEFRGMTNGLRLSYVSGLPGALMRHGLPAVGGEQKDAMRELILTGGPWSVTEQAGILDYCETDVVGRGNLTSVMNDQIDWPRALLRGRYMQAVSRIQMNGIPLDMELLERLQAHWPSIQDQLISEIDSSYSVYDGRTFKVDRWEKYLVVNGIPWRRLESGEARPAPGHVPCG